MCLQSTARAIGERTSPNAFSRHTLMPYDRHTIGAYDFKWRSTKFTSRACLPSQRTCYCGAVSKIRPLVYCGYSFVHIICCLFCSFIFCLLVLCYIAHHWIFLRRTVNKSHLSFTSTGQAIILFCFPDLKRPAVDLQVSQCIRR